MYAHSRISLHYLELIYIMHAHIKLLLNYSHYLVAITHSKTIHDLITTHKLDKKSFTKTKTNLIDFGYN